MKSYKRLIGIVVAIFLLLCISVNLWLIRGSEIQQRSYMVEISRVAAQMENQLEKQPENQLDNQVDRIPESELATYVEQSTYIKRIISCQSQDELVASSRYPYCIKQVGNQLYRFEYEEGNQVFEKLLWMVNGIMAIMLLLLICVLGYVYTRIIRLFSDLENVPYELSKGNLTLELPQEKAKYFGKFIWGINMLRENIQQRREKELNMHREKKLLLLSLTHDIKTPLSVIKLNSQALQRGLYKDEEKKKAALDSIIGKVDEIEGYVTEITRASKEDFLDLEVREEEFYLSNVIEEIQKYYTDKMSLKKIQFQITTYKDCLLSGDENRLVEVIQNLIENAIKYGDGREIGISFAEEEGCKLITIENSGSSLESSELMKIFDSFYRGSNIASQSGSGLGLYICRQLMHGMNGDIFAKQTETHFQMTVVVRKSE